jgi:hypothetical protein
VHRVREKHLKRNRKALQNSKMTFRFEDEER